jgi:hypothetical protein
MQVVARARIDRSLRSNTNLEETMKSTILALAMSMAIAGTAVAQTSGPGAATAPSGSTMPRNSPSAALGLNSSAPSSSPSVQDPSQGATGAVSPTQPGSATEPSTGTPVNGTPDSPGAKNGTGKK